MMIFMKARFSDALRSSSMVAAGGLCLLLSSVASAAPSITGISGNTTNGSTVTISGSGFGTGDATPLLWDDFDDTAASTGARMASSPRVGGWSPAGDATYSSSQKNSGSRSLRATFTSSAQWNNFTVTMPNGAKFFQSFWFYYAGSGTNGQVKLALVHGNSGKGEFAPTINNNSSTTTWWMTNVATESQAGTQSGSWPTNPGPGAWHHFEMALGQSSGNGAADGSVTIWVNGVQQYSKKNIVTRDSASYYWNEMGFLHGVTNMGTTTDTYLDDVYANNSWARVVLCDAATYSACKKSEIQPAQSWADGSISVKLAQSAFSNPANAYLYVIDANGTANSAGFKLCSNCGVTTKVPSAPTLQSVQ
jgi:hypothetical protein